MTTLDNDRRRHPRVSIQRPCKIFEPRSGKYLPATTCDFSAGGMLLALSRPLNLSPGDRLFVGIAQKRRQMLLRSSDMIRVRIVRCMLTSDDRTLLGVELVDPALADETQLRRAA